MEVQPTLVDVRWLQARAIVNAGSSSSSDEDSGELQGSDDGSSSAQAETRDESLGQHQASQLPQQQSDRTVQQQDRTGQQQDRTGQHEDRTGQQQGSVGQQQDRTVQHEQAGKDGAELSGVLQGQDLRGCCSVEARCQGQGAVVTLLMHVQVRPQG